MAICWQAMLRMMIMILMMMMIIIFKRMTIMIRMEIKACEHKRLWHMSAQIVKLADHP